MNNQENNNNGPLFDPASDKVDEILQRAIIDKRKSLSAHLYRSLNSSLSYREREDDIKMLFSSDFISTINVDPISNSAFRIMVQDGDIFDLVENLCGIIKDQQNKLTQLLDIVPSRIISV